MTGWHITCKSMKHIVYSQIMNHLDSHNILVEFQHGFCSGHSCETQLLNMVEDMSQCLDRRQATDLLILRRQATDMLILDFSKAFDTVPHCRLLHNLQYYWVTGRTNKWIQSWLCHCQQRVVLDESTSSDSKSFLAFHRAQYLAR